MKEKCIHEPNHSGEWIVRNKKSFGICGKCGEEYRIGLFEPCNCEDHRSN
jgi:hypothetical protein